MRTYPTGSPSISCWTLAVTILASISAIGVTATSAVAQGPALRLGIIDDRGVVPTTPQAKPNAKDEGTATILSIVIIGAGQMYAGDTRRGLIMLGGAYGALIAGAALSSCDTGGCSTAPLALGLIGWLGIGIYSIIDAAPTTRRMNKARGLAQGPLSPAVFVGREGQVGLGLRVGL